LPLKVLIAARAAAAEDRDLVAVGDVTGDLEEKRTDELVALRSPGSTVEEDVGSRLGDRGIAAGAVIKKKVRDNIHTSSTTSSNKAAAAESKKTRDTKASKEGGATDSILQERAGSNEIILNVVKQALGVSIAALLRGGGDNLAGLAGGLGDEGLGAVGLEPALRASDPGEFLGRCREAEQKGDEGCCVGELLEGACAHAGGRCSDGLDAELHAERCERRSAPPLG
jgi:hypothetical protein